jgi:hypothetical protein
LCNKFLGLHFNSLMYAPLEIIIWGDKSRKICGNILEVIRHDSLKDDEGMGVWDANLSFLQEQCQGRLDPVVCLSLQLAVHEHRDI